jgi:hypothetical protein
VSSASHVGLRHGSAARPGEVSIGVAESGRFHTNPTFRTITLAISAQRRDEATISESIDPHMA